MFAVPFVFIYLREYFLSNLFTTEQTKLKKNYSNVFSYHQTPPWRYVCSQSFVVDPVTETLQ